MGWGGKGEGKAGKEGRIGGLWEGRRGEREFVGRREGKR